MTADDAPYDLVIAGGRVIDPAQGIDAALDVAIREGHIAAVHPRITAPSGCPVLDVSGDLVTPGFIDHHAHCFEHFTDLGVNPDSAGLSMGLVAVVEQGTVGATTFGAFERFVVRPSATDVLCYVSVHVAGDPKGGHWEFHGPDSADVKRTVKVCLENRDVIRGIKAHAELGLYSRWGTKPLALAKLAAMGADLPLAAHIGNLFRASPKGEYSAETVLRDSLTLLDPGDVLVHPFTGNPGGIIDRDGKVKPEVREAYDRGVLFDVAHGIHFNFEIAKRALDQGLKPHIISSDAHHEVHGGRLVRWGTRHLRYTLWGAIAKLMALGISVEEIVEMTATTPAVVLRQQHRWGSLRPGMPAEISVLRVYSGSWVLRDGRHHSIAADRCLLPRFVIKGGQIHEVGRDVAFDLTESPS